MNDKTYKYNVWKEEVVEGKTTNNISEELEFKLTQTDLLEFLKNNYHLMRAIQYANTDEQKLWEFSHDRDNLKRFFSSVLIGEVDKIELHPKNLVQYMELINFYNEVMKDFFLILSK